MGFRARGPNLNSLDFWLVYFGKHSCQAIGLVHGTVAAGQSLQLLSHVNAPVLFSLRQHVGVLGRIGLLQLGFTVACRRDVLRCTWLGRSRIRAYGCRCG